MRKLIPLILGLAVVALLIAGLLKPKNENETKSFDFRSEAEKQSIIETLQKMNLKFEISGNTVIVVKD